MAKAARPSALRQANLSADRIIAAIPQLQARIADLNEININVIQQGDEPAIHAIETRIEQTLARVFGPDTHEYAQLREAASLDLTPYLLSFAGGPQMGSKEIRDGVDQGRRRAITLLTEAVRSLEETLEFAPKKAVPPSSEPLPRNVPPLTKEVFVVHGRDNPARTELCLVLTRAGLTPIVLHEQANEGRTIIEKFEAHAGLAGFAVVLLTPDDEGGPAGGTMRPRARQNVVGEMFWFAAKLGRTRVCALRKGDVEIPSDFAGVVYTEMDDRGAWKHELLRELQNAGYTVDWARALA